MRRGPAGSSLLERVACIPRPAPPGRLAEEALSAGCRLVELRLDILGYSRAEARQALERLSPHGVRVIATLRDAGEGGRYSGPAEEKLETLLYMLDHGAWLIDVEYRFPLLDEALRQAPGRVLASIHDFRWTPPPEVLYSYAGDMLRRGAAVAKIATMARSLGDNWRILGVNARWPGRVAAFAMGRRGRLSRILAPLIGGALTYASLGDPVAPGQLSLEELLEAWRLMGVLGEEA
ncbi:hypothetical protein CF15_06750 [Pyrodictium occultum]|uniref:3-dehydroquinate dehydratase n=1 Tax=Pyrodictium occultum TaxID=2309 RepID=A0A0V8RWL9_PYROC|nr:type I 3-dehydroquinate dehydratase [Pyrodictium occultum]KSW12420.1 hypothetical protein CF15_06750 [Pyrodictium occultum]